MNEIEEIMQKCIELGKAIAQTEVYKEFKKAEYALLKDAEARKLIEDLQKMKNEQRGKVMAGIEVTEKEKDQLKELENKCLHNNQVFSSNNTNTKFQKLMEEITKNIKNGIKSVDK